jgi:hypothetical protein
MVEDFLKRKAKVTGEKGELKGCLDVKAYVNVKLDLGVFHIFCIQ